MAEFPPVVLAFVALTALFSVGAGIKAVWHNCQLRRGGERPLGMYSQLRNPTKGERP